MRRLNYAKRRALSLFITLILFGVSANSFSQTKAPGPKAEEETLIWNSTLQHVTLVVSDFKVSEKFYKGLLGLKEIPAPWLPDNQMFLALGENLELHVGEVQGVEIRPSDFNHFAFAVFIPLIRSVGQDDGYLPFPVITHEPPVDLQDEVLKRLLGPQVLLSLRFTLAVVIDNALLNDPPVSVIPFRHLPSIEGFAVK